MSAQGLQTYVQLARESSKRADLALIYRGCCDQLLEDNQEKICALVEPLSPHDRVLLGHHLGHDGNMLSHRICSGAVSNIASYIELFHELDILVDTPNREGRTPLHVLVTLGGMPEALSSLISYGADANRPVPDSVGRRPLHMAAELLDFESIRVLNRAGVDMNAKDNKGIGCGDIIWDAGGDIEYRNWLAEMAVFELKEQNLIAEECPEETGQRQRSARAL